MSVVSRELVQQSVAPISSLNDAEADACLADLRFVSCKAGAMFLREGAQIHGIGLVMTGLFRVYYLTPDGDQLTRRFVLAGRAIGDLSSLVLKIPARVSIEALEDSEVLTIDHAKLETLYERFPGWQRLGRVLAERYCTVVETREYQFLAFPAKERYRLFRAEFPGLEDRVSQVNIASYLGISPVSLSRIRSGSR